MRFLNPKTDFAFKKIFGSNESTEILLSFLNAESLLDLIEDDALIAETTSLPLETVRMLRSRAAGGSA